MGASVAAPGKPSIPPENGAGATRERGAAQDALRFRSRWNHDKGETVSNFRMANLYEPGMLKYWKTRVLRRAGPFRKEVCDGDRPRRRPFQHHFGHPHAWSEWGRAALPAQDPFRPLPDETPRQDARRPVVFHHRQYLLLPGYRKRHPGSCLPGGPENRGRFGRRREKRRHPSRAASQDAPRPAIPEIAGDFPEVLRAAGEVSGACIASDDAPHEIIGTSSTAGTIFLDTRHPRSLWFRAVWSSVP